MNEERLVAGLDIGSAKTTAITVKATDVDDVDGVTLRYRLPGDNGFRDAKMTRNGDRWRATVTPVDQRPNADGKASYYVVAEDAGVLVNPMVVDGQIRGGVAQGIGSALFEEMPFDTQGQPLAATLAEYLLPGCVEMPNIRIRHMETPSPYTEFGQKGVGEGGAIGPAAAIANAVNDAMRTLGVELCEIPISPPRILKALAAAKAVSVDGERSGVR